MSPAIPSSALLLWVIAQTNPAFRPIGPGQFELGLVRLDANTRTITLPCEVNMTEGPVEYLLVGAGGKLHESILRTQAEPLHLHLAMILLGFPEKPKVPPTPPGQRPGLLGVPIELHIRFPGSDPVPASTLVQKTQGRPFSGQPWVYNGSQHQGGVFLAQTGRSIIALMEDFTSLANTSDIDRINDKIWRPKPGAVSEIGTPADLILHFPQP